MTPGLMLPELVTWFQPAGLTPAVVVGVVDVGVVAVVVGVVVVVVVGGLSGGAWAAELVTSDQFPGVAVVSALSVLDAFSQRASIAL